ncbi:Scr1 family TA system antitoxin-like transcriptional regulator [Kitasatospora sp. NPDC056076]|uniref:helix-turn-helix domain-containing protein n=1 Tax=Kitasatospora sp. NPDC056076 TaxID=3345703 RepID=UPI0035D6CAEF
MSERESDPQGDSAIEFGTLLRTSRVQRGWTQEHLAHLLGCSAAYISALENGRKKPSQPFVTRLDRVFESGEQFLREWGKSGGHALFEGFDEYLRSEARAVSLRIFEVNILPGLFQTREYATAYQNAPVIRGAATRQQADDRTERLLRRQLVLARDPAPVITAVIDESALRRVIGGRDVMIAQLEHLETLAAQPRYLVQICPASAGENRPFGHPITLLTMPNRATLGYGETERRGFLERDPATLAAWTSEYDHLQAEALPRAPSLEFIRDVRKGLEHG